MIKINLLPRTIDEKRAVRNMAMVLGVLLVAIIAAGFTFSLKLRGDVKTMEERAEAAKAWKERVERIQAEASAVRKSIEPIQQKVDFVNAVLDYNQKYPKLYKEIAKWTYEKVIYSSLQPSADGVQVQMQARVKTLDDLGRYLLNMYRATDLFTSVTISGIPGYPRTSSGLQRLPGGPRMFPGGPDYEREGIAPSSELAGIEAIAVGVRRRPEDDWIAFTVNCVLREQITPPVLAGAAPVDSAARPGMPGAAPTARRMPTPGPVPTTRPMPGRPMMQPSPKP